MRVLYVIDSLAAGGAEQSLASFAPHCIAAGVEMDVAYLHESCGLQTELEAADARVFSVAGSGGRLGGVRRARRLMVRLQPDLVHTTLFEADLAGRVAAAFCRVPVVSTLAGTPYGPEHLADPGVRRWKARGAQMLETATARVVRRFHAVSEHVAAVMSRRLRIPRDRIEVIPRGRDPLALGRRSDERRKRVRRQLGLQDGAPMVLAAARHEFPKGLDVMLEAFRLLLREVPQAHLLVAGPEGNATPALLSTVDRLGLRDHAGFLGLRGDVPDLLCAADVFVLPSRREGFPGVLLEAMALETPIVASDIDPVREVVGDDSVSRLVPPGQLQPLAEAIGRLLADPDQATERARRGRQRFLERFTIERVAAQMVEFYLRALAATR